LKQEQLFSLIKAQSLQKYNGVTFHHFQIEEEDIRDNFEINWKPIITPFYIEYHRVARKVA